MNLIDELDYVGNKTGRKITIEHAAKNGKWHNSVHAVIITKDNHIIAQKRSSNIVTNPGRIEVSAGGCVDSGEECIDAVAREVKEELGINIDKKDFILTDRKKWFSYHPSIKRYTACFLHSYVAILDDYPELEYKPQESESSKIFELSKSQAIRLARLHRLKKIGHLSSGYAYWDRAIKEACDYMNPKIHFVCRGNTFRSRLAESIMKKKRRKGITSSGIYAKRNKNGNISTMASHLTLKHKLNKFKKYTWTQTNQLLLNRSDLVVFMSPTVFKDAEKLFDLSKVNYTVWNVPDIADHNMPGAKNIAEDIFSLINHNIKTGLRKK